MKAKLNKSDVKTYIHTDERIKVICGIAKEKHTFLKFENMYDKIFIYNYKN